MAKIEYFEEDENDMRSLFNIPDALIKGKRTAIFYSKYAKRYEGYYAGGHVCTADTYEDAARKLKRNIEQGEQHPELYS